MKTFQKYANIETKKETITTGRYKFIYIIEPSNAEKLQNLQTSKKEFFIEVDGVKKSCVLNSVKVKNGVITADVSILQNPIPIAIIAYGVAGILGIGTIGWTLSEVNESVDKLLIPAIIITGIYFFGKNK